MTQDVLFIPVTGIKLPVTRNIVFFTGKDSSVIDTPFVTQSFLVTWVLGKFHHVIGNVPPITRSTVFV